MKRGFLSFKPPGDICRLVIQFQTMWYNISGGSKNCMSAELFFLPISPDLLLISFIQVVKISCIIFLQSYEYNEG